MPLTNRAGAKAPNFPDDSKAGLIHPDPRKTGVDRGTPVEGPHYSYYCSILTGAPSARLCPPETTT